MKTTISASIEIDNAIELEKICKLQDISRTDLIVKAIELYKNKYSKELQVLNAEQCTPMQNNS